MTQQSVLIRIVDDEESIRSSLSFMLEQEGFRVVSYASAEDFLRQDMPSEPGCVLLDVRMTGMSGLALQDIMIERGMVLPIIFLSAHGCIDMAVDTMQKGAVAFIEKTADRTRLIQAIYRALRVGQFGKMDDPGREMAAWMSLTEREQEVAQLIAEGLLNREVAQRLGIAAKTVQVYRGEVCKKLGVKGAAGISQAVNRIRLIQEQQSQRSGSI